MKNKITEWDKCVQYLVEHPGWNRVVEMRGRESTLGFIGSEADRRMMQVMDYVKKDGWYELNGIRYFIEEGKEGKFKTYRITGSKQKMPEVVKPIYQGREIVGWRRWRKMFVENMSPERVKLPIVTLP